MKKVSVFVALALASVALVACGGSDSTTTTSTPAAPANEAGGGSGGAAQTGTQGASQTLKLEADPTGQLKYTTDKLTAKAGTVTIDLNNPAPVAHDVAVEDSSGKELGKSDVVTQGSTSLTLNNLKPGTYTFFCTVPGHRQAGMEGTLVVK